MSDKRCGVLNAHDPHAWGGLNWCPGAMTSVPPTQPPAAPETDVRLTEVEREVLADAFVRYSHAPEGWAAAVAPAVERIVAERVRVVEGERDRLQRWKDEALPVIDGLQDLGKALGLPLGERITGPAAVEAARSLTARTESAEAAHAAMRADLTELADYWATVRSHAYRTHAVALRALLAGGEER